MQTQMNHIIENCFSQVAYAKWTGDNRDLGFRR